MSLALPTYDDVQAAAGRVAGVVHRTPVVTCSAIDARAGVRVFMKCENFQKGGAFKARGATNAVALLTDEAAARGVTTHSSGNHAQALALAARARGVKATIVIPEDAPAVKIAAVKGYGAEVVLCPPTLAAREEACDEVIAGTGATLVHPYEDPRVVAGQGTAADELLEQVPDLDAVIAPVGGGGLMAGTCLAVRGRRGRDCLAFGVEPELADDAKASLEAGEIQPARPPVTIADGVRTSLGEIAFGVLRRELEDIALVSEEAIAEAMRFIWERAKLVVEPSAALPLAALFEGTLPLRDAQVGVILSGGNVQLDRLPWGGST